MGYLPAITSLNDLQRYLPRPAIKRAAPRVTVRGGVAWFFRREYRGVELVILARNARALTPSALKAMLTGPAYRDSMQIMFQKVPETSRYEKTLQFAVASVTNHVSSEQAQRPLVLVWHVNEPYLEWRNQCTRGVDWPAILERVQAASELPALPLPDDSSYGLSISVEWSTDRDGVRSLLGSRTYPGGCVVPIHEWETWHVDDLVRSMKHQLSSMRPADDFALCFGSDDVLRMTCADGHAWTSALTGLSAAAKGALSGAGATVAAAEARMKAWNEACERRHRAAKKAAATRRRNSRPKQNRVGMKPGMRRSPATRPAAVAA
jgi:hypothetical protein